MNYEVHIEDKENLEDPLILHYAARNSISVNWLGGDDKTKPIIGSEVNFTLEVGNGEDAKYDQYFTSNEQKWLVTKRISETQEIVWQGFLLPESYSEPYENPLFYVNLCAVDGLGLLKGKKLSEDFYEKEKSVIEIISACLRLTGLDFDVFLSPAIQNHAKKYWHEIYIDTRKYEEEKEEDRASAYDFLEEIISSMRCQIFQAEGRWYIEGINKRHLITVNYHTYNSNGDFLGTRDISKNIKKVDWRPVPMITMVPAFKKVTVAHESEKLEFPQEFYQETEIEWIKSPGVEPEIYPRFWNYSPLLQPVMKAPDYFLEINGNNAELMSGRFISLKEKPYLLKGWKIKIELKFKLILNADISIDQIQQHIDDQDWVNEIIYQILHNGNSRCVNFFIVEDDPKTLFFNTDLEATGSFEFITEEDGFLDIRLYQPSGIIAQTNVEAVKLTKMSIEKLGAEIDFSFTKTISEKSSQIKEIELEIGTDVSGLSKSFYPEKIREYDNEDYFVIMAPILYGFSQNGNNYSVVPLKYAQLIEQFIDQVAYGNIYGLLKNPEVIYNLNGGEQMVVKSDELITNGYFYVPVKKYKNPQIDRSEWTLWSDSLYGIEYKDYLEIVAEIEANLFAAPHLRIEGTAAAPLKFNDIVSFEYKGKTKYFTIGNLEWFPDENESNVILTEGVYAGNSLGNIPPYVYAGPDLYLAENEFQTQITQAVATDPSGFIANLLWEKISGDAGEVISDNEIINPEISNLTGNEYTFKLTATDNLGATASDTMKIFRVGDYLLILELVDSYSDIPDPIEDASWITRKDTYKVKTQPTLPAGETITFNFDVRLYRNLTNPPRTSPYSGRVVLQKQGLKIYDFNRTYRTRGDEITDDSKFNNVNYIAADNLEVILETTLIANTSAPQDEVSAEINFTGAVFKQETAEVSNLPVNKKLRMQLADYL